MSLSLTDSPWVEEWKLFAEMSVQINNPSDIGGNNSDPIDEIIAQLQSGNPDWNSVMQDLDKMQVEAQDMINVANEYGLKRNDFPKELQNLLLTIENLKNVIRCGGGIGEFEPLFSSLGGILTSIKQSILQG